MTIRLQAAWCVVLACVACDATSTGTESPPSSTSTGSADASTSTTGETEATTNASQTTSEGSADTGDTDSGWDSSGGGYDTDFITDTDDPVGCDEWTYTVLEAGGNTATASALAPVTDGIVLAGSPSSDGVSLRATAGETVWAHEQLAGPDTTLFVQNVLALDDDTFIVAGRRSGPNPAVVWLAQLNAAGAQAWQHEYGRIDLSVWAHLDLERHPDGGFVLSTTGEGSVGGNDLRAIRIDDSGNTLWDLDVGSGGPIA